MEGQDTLDTEILLDIYTVNKANKIQWNFLFYLSCYFVTATYVNFHFFFLIVGKKAYSITWTLQYINLFMINTGYIILAGSALKVRQIYEPFNENYGLI